MKSPRTAREHVRKARQGATLSARDWNLIEDYLSELVSRGIHEPGEVADRLERRGRPVTDPVTGEQFTWEGDRRS